MRHVKAAFLGVAHPHRLAHLRTPQAIPEVESILLWHSDPAMLNAVQCDLATKVEASYTDLECKRGVLLPTVSSVISSLLKYV